MNTTRTNRNASHGGRSGRSPWRARPASAVLALGLLAGGVSVAGVRSVAAEPELAGAGRDPSISGDGTKVVFVAPDPVSQLDAVWLRDRATGEATELTVPGEGVRPGASRSPVISGDGCTVAVVTEMAFDLFRDDDVNSRWDVYRTVLPGCEGAFDAGEWELVSSTSVGEPTARNDVSPDQRPAMSASGNVVVYARAAVPDGGKFAAWLSLDTVDVTVPFGEPGRVVAVPGLPSVLPTTANSYVGQIEPAVSADGSYVAFTTDALITVTLADPTDPEAFDTIDSVWAGGIEQTGPAVTQVYLWDRLLGSDDDSLPITLVSARQDGRPGDGPSGQPAISAIGDVVAFVSSATDLLVDPIVSAPQIYRTLLRPEPQTTLVSSRNGMVGNAASSAPTLDATGQIVAFTSQADNLTDVTSSRRGVGGDLLVADTVNGGISLVTTRPDGYPALPAAYRPDLSDSGDVVVFESEAAAQLVAGAGLGEQIVLLDRPTTVAISSVDVGTILVGADSTEWFTALQNTGPSAFVIGDVTVDDPAVRLTGGGCVQYAVLAPGGSCEVRFVVNPAADGPVRATITVSQANGPLVATATVTGVGGTPSIVAEPAGADLGTAVVGGETEPLVVRFSNPGVFTELISRVVKGGVNTADLNVVIDGCTGATLEPGAFCELALRAEPTGDGPRNMILTAFTEAGGTASTVLSSIGEYRPGIAVDTTVLGPRRLLSVTGLGFPASTIVTVGWEGDDHTVRTMTGPDGTLRVRIAAPPNTYGRAAVRVLDAEGRFAPTVSDPILIQREVRRPLGT